MKKLKKGLELAPAVRKVIGANCGILKNPGNV